jgi:hypothetical protein
MKTIKQIADEIGVSKQAVFYRIKKEPLSNALQPFMTNNDGVLTVSFDGETLIKTEFLRNNSYQTFDVKEATKRDSFDAPIIDLLRETIDTLKTQLESKDKQLESKDKQIEELTLTIKSLSESINAANQTKLAETIIDTQSSLPPASEKVSIWDKLFKRNKN